jgi:DUF4097 and DUF4098 domain-containing protein YvlB
MAIGVDRRTILKIAMNTLLLKLSAAGLLTGTIYAVAVAGAAAPNEDRIKKSFSAGPGGQLAMDVDLGSIDVKTTDGTVVEVEVIRSVSGVSGAKIAETLKNHVIEFSQQGSNVRIHSEFKGDRRRFWFQFNRGAQLRVRYLISVPKKYNTDLATSGGNISIADLEGKAQARTSGGNLLLGNIGGPVWARTSGGRISVDGCKQTVDVETSGGDLNIGEVDGAVVAKTSGGSIRIRKARTDVAAKTSGGNIEVADVGGRIDAITSGGSVTAHLSRQPKGNCSLRTSGGNIAVMLAETIAVDLDAKTSGGRVIADIPGPGQEQPKKTELRSKINGGGPLLFLETSGGNVHIRRL